MIFVLFMVYGALVPVHVYYLPGREIRHQFDIEYPGEAWGITMAFLCILWPLYWAGRLADAGTQKLLPPAGEDV